MEHLNFLIPIDNTASLSKRELEILRLICNEQTNKDISAVLNISEHTVKGHRENIYQKTRVSNAIGLFKYAIKNNLVPLT